jgi:hypothetical protein
MYSSIAPKGDAEEDPTQEEAEEDDEIADPHVLVDTKYRSPRVTEARVEDQELLAIDQDHNGTPHGHDG